MCTLLSSVSISDSVTSIGKWCFKSCTSLNDINLSKNVAEIRNGTFEGCTSLTSIIIPEGVRFLDYSAFWRCTYLTKITLPGTLSSFYDSNNLTISLFEQWSKNSTIYGYSGTSAKIIAEKNNIAFVDLGETFTTGDINNDGEVNVADALTLKKYLLGSGNLSNKKNADIIKDDTINVFDLCRLKQMLL